MPPALSVSSLRVLVIDDNRDQAQSLALLLRIQGHQADTAQDGPSADKAARAHLPDVLLVDIGLQGQDGYAVAKQLRPLFASKPLLVALTGYGQETDRRRSREEGFDYHLVKPVEPDELLSLLEKHARALATCSRGEA
jgi:CheY-like chemotaxis protein